MIRTINEQLRINKNIILTNDNPGVSENLYALRTGKKADGSSHFEKQRGREPNTVKSNIVKELLGKSMGVSEQDSRATSAATDFEEDIDTTILVRRRARGSKLEPVFFQEEGKGTQRDRAQQYLPTARRKEG